MPASIEIIGKDYTEISPEQCKCIDADGKAKAIHEDEIDEIRKILGEIDKNKESLTINLRNKNNKDEVYLFSSDEASKIGRFGNVVGFLRYVNESYDVMLQIGSRMDGERPYFLNLMFQAALDDFKFNEGMVPSNLNELFEMLLVYWYKKQLIEAYLIGPYRRYQRFEENGCKIRGSIDIARHIRLNIGLNNGKIAYSYRENTVDNVFNHLLIRTYLEMKKSFSGLVSKVIDQDFQINKIIKELMFLAPSYAQRDVRTVLKYNQQCITQPYYQSYEKLRKTCLRILYHMGVSFGKDGEEVEGILFYIPSLWERYLEKLFKEKLKFPFKSQEKIEIISSGEAGDKFINNTYPDFVFYKDFEKTRPFMILDAKWRPNWKNVMETGKLKETNKRPSWDYWSDYNKCIRDMYSVGGNASGVVFPVNKEKPKGEIEHRISRYNENGRFYTFPIYVPETDKSETDKPETDSVEFGFDDWKDKLEKENMQIISKMEEVLKTEMEKTQKNTEKNI